ncbi:MAG: hypothetical protein EHM28_13110 [Spirochaetaceae bacterium]|nr:MAG: hypothetical protein EHM28_13110 [Spirochaetaceae bacterium]
MEETAILMDIQSANCIFISGPENRIQAILDSTATGVSALGKPTPQFSLHFAQNEDFFIRLSEPFTVPQFGIHHTIGSLIPEDAYMRALTSLLEQLTSLAPQVFAGLTFFFNATDIFHPCFYRLTELEGELFLYLFRIDLGFKPGFCEITIRGTNDLSHCFKSSSLFCEGLLIPIKQILSLPDKGMECLVREIISETWIGETGRGYRVKGIWIDDDLSKFFTRLFTSPGKRLYPFFPFVCRYKTICLSVIRFGIEALGSQSRLLKSALEILQPEISNIENALKKNRYNDDLAELAMLKKKVDPSLCSGWDDVIVETYPNQQGNREYLVSEKNH